MAKGERVSRHARKQRQASGGSSTPPARTTQQGRPKAPPTGPVSQERIPARSAGQGHKSQGTDTAGYLGLAVPQTPAPTWRRRLYIERLHDLAAAVALISQARLIAIDAEFSQARVLQPGDPTHRLALLQLATDDEYDTSYVIDAQRLADLSPLEPVFQNPAIRKLFHGIGSDARVLATRGLVARNTLDLEAVSRSVFGQRESGLQTMLQRACGIRLDKSFQRADWSRRPLTQSMIAYAARDAEMTFVLYGWLALHYPCAVSLHELAADEAPPPVAAWVLPYLEGARPRPAFYAVAQAGIGDDLAAQEEALRTALAVVRHPTQRARVMRLITDLELTRLAPDLRPYLSAPASEERAGAARGIGRLHDKAAIELIRPLLNDVVQDVRQAAGLAIETLTGAPPPPRVPRPTLPVASGQEGSVRWMSAASDAAQPDEGCWQAQLRARFGLPKDGAAPTKDAETSVNEPDLC